MTLDLVLQATGFHSHNVSEGWVNAARALGVLGRLFRPFAEWDAPMESDNGLFDYLGHPKSDAMLLLGFDWHSQALHNTPRWRGRWIACPSTRIIYAHESIGGDVILTGSNRALKAAISADLCADMWVYTDIKDDGLFGNFGKAAFYQPFGVDTSVFKSMTHYAERKPMPFFRGKVEFDFMPGVAVYQDRRRLVRHLEYRKLLDVERFDFKPLDAATLAAQYNERRIVVNFPSVFPGHPTRVTEALACGCTVITNRTGKPELDREFLDKKHLFYYDPDDAVALEDLVRWCMANEDTCGYVAGEGRQWAENEFSLELMLKEILERVEKL